MADRSAFVHIGLAKTGTTAIQDFLSSNRAFLKEQGYHVPRAGTMNAQSGHHCLAWEIRKADERLRYCAGFELSRFENEVGAHPGDHIVVSSEELSLSSYSYPQVRQILSLFDQFNVTVVAYVREQAEYFNAFYTQLAVNLLDVEPVERFVERCMGEARFDYNSWFAIWDDLSKTPVRIRPYDVKVFEGGDVVRDFAALIGPIRFPESYRAARSNRSMNNKQVGALQWLFQQMKAAGCSGQIALNARRRLEKAGKEVAALPELSDGDPVWLIEPNLVRRIRERYAEANATFFERHGARGYVFGEIGKDRSLNALSFNGLDRPTRDRVNQIWMDAHRDIASEIGQQNRKWRWGR
jgi:hypothetical protein